MTTWRLTDYGEPANDEEEPRCFNVESLDALSDLLGKLRDSEPRVFELLSPMGEVLKIGMGGPLGTVIWGKPPVHRNIRNVIANEVVTDNPVGFAYQGEIDEFGPEYILPVDQVIGIITCFFETHSLPGWVSWKSWNASTWTWDVIPARETDSPSAGG